MSIQVKNLRNLEKNFSRIAERIGIDMVTLHKKIAFDIFAGIVADTPVDTGRAMNNWNISVGSPDRTVVDGGGSAGSIKSDKQGEAATALAGLGIFSTVWISNSLPYIVALNEGSSTQAPKGFVERNIVNELSRLTRVL